MAHDVQRIAQAGKVLEEPKKQVQSRRGQDLSRSPAGSRQCP